MSSRQRQSQYLNAMGIPVWVAHRSLSGERVAPLQNHQEGDIVRESSSESVETDSPVSNTSEWQVLQSEVSQCVACELHQTRTQTVFGVGDPNAQWMLIGEAPGADEDRKGEPFVGRAGQLLNQMLLGVGLSREAVFIANILKCRPPNNRDPKVDEISACSSFLRRQIEVIQPKIILAVGRVSAQSLLNTGDPIGRIRGKVYHHDDTGVPIVATYHPAYLLRSPQEKRKSWEDLVLAKRTLMKNL